jgi:hypothetical protein
LTGGHLDRLRGPRALHLDPARLLSLGHRDNQMQHTVGVARFDVLGVVDTEPCRRLEASFIELALAI